MDNKTNVFSKKYVTGEGSWTTLTNNEKEDIKVIKYLKDWGIFFTQQLKRLYIKRRIPWVTDENLRLTEDVLISLAWNVLLTLRVTAAESATDAIIQKKLYR